MTTDIAHWAEGRRDRPMLIGMLGMGLKAFARALFRGRPRTDVSQLSPWLLRDIGLQRGPVTRIPTEGGADGAADRPYTRTPPAIVPFRSAARRPANDNIAATPCAA